MRLHRVLAAGTVAMAGVLGFASLAWGCATVTSPFVTLAPNRGPAATAATATGENWEATTNLTLRWATAEGKVLATTTTDTSGRFAVRITVPEAAAGVYYVVAVQTAVPTDTVRRTPFEVIVAGGADDTGGQNSPQGTTSLSTSGGKTPSSAADPAGSGTADPVATTGSGGLPTPGSRTAPDTATGPADAPAAGQAVAASPGQATGATATPLRSAPVAGAPERRESQVTVSSPEPAVADEEAVRPRDASATGDVWGGLTDGPSRLTPSLVDLPGRSGSTSPAVVGAMAAVLGLLGLVGGFATAEVRRRRVTVSQDSRP